MQTQQDEFDITKLYSQPPAPNPGYQVMNAAQNIGGGAAMGGLVGAGLGVAKTGLDIYQGFENQNAAERAYKNQLQAYETTVLRQQREREQQEEAQRIANLYAGANVAKQYGDDEAAKYRDYYQSTGGF